MHKPYVFVFPRVHDFFYMILLILTVNDDDPNKTFHMSNLYS